MKIYPELNKVTINEDDSTFRLQCMPMHPMVWLQASLESLTALCPIYQGPHMLSIVNTWGCMQYFVESCFAIVTTGFCSVSLTRMHWHPVPQQIKKSYTRATMHWYTKSNRWGIFFLARFFAKSLDDGLFDSHRWCTYTPPVPTKHFFP
jgi:hypothetical protein